MVDWAAGVPAAGGELGVESDAISVLELGAATRVAEVAGDCLAGVSSLTKSGSTMARSFWGSTLRVMRRLDLEEAALVMAAAVLFDFLRSLAAAAVLLEGGIAANKMASMW